MLPPVGAAQHAHDGRSHRGAFAPGNAVEVDRSSHVQPINGGPLQGFGNRRRLGNDGDADIGLHQFDQVALGGDFVAAIDVDAVLAQRLAKAVGMLAIISRQQLLRPQVLEVNAFAFRQPMLPADDEMEILGEKRPGVEPVPVLAKFGGDAEFGLALLQHLGDLAAVAAEKSEFHAVELPLDLIEDAESAAKDRRNG